MADAALRFLLGGAGFVTGLTLVAAAVGLKAIAPHRPRTTRALLVVGVLILAVSATPLHWGWYAMLGAAFVGWIGAERRPNRKHRIVTRAVLPLACLTAAAVELPHQFLPRVAVPTGMRAAVIGDSLTAGMGGEAATWPDLLAKRTGLRVRNLAVAGATAGSAGGQAARLEDAERLVIVEIGGNDLLGGLSSDAAFTGEAAAEFERDLNALLDAVRRPGRTVVMFELPLPPFCNAYGRAQRRAAQRHGVALIPKRVLLGVLTRGGNTLDGLHLSPRGHSAMAAAVESVVRAAP